LMTQPAYAKMEAKMTDHYRIYTQVDGDDGEVYYVKGWQFVDRTGVYAIVPYSEDNPDVYSTDDLPEDAHTLEFL